MTSYPLIVEIRGTRGCALVGDPGTQPRYNPKCLWSPQCTATILNPFHNMEYKIIDNLRQNDACMKAGIPCRNLATERYNAFLTGIVYVSNDAIFPVTSMKSQMNTKSTQKLTVSAHEWDRSRFEIYESALQHSYISSCTRALPSIFDSVSIKNDQIKVFQ